ncbi:MFS transporter [Sphingomonas sp. MMS24-JH45]
MATRNETEAASSAPAAPIRPASNVRWVICALLFLATTINYIDRQIIGILKPTLQGELGWSESDYASIVFWFQAAYAIGCSPAVDRPARSRLGYAAAIGLWSFAAMIHAFVRTPLGFSGARFMLGLGESANFPAAIKSVSEWFPGTRALAAGILNAGANVGALATPIVVPLLTIYFGWKRRSSSPGCSVSCWLLAWLASSPPGRAQARLAVRARLYRGGFARRADDADAVATAVRAAPHLGLRHRQVLPTDPVWYLFLWRPRTCWRSNMAWTSRPSARR